MADIRSLLAFDGVTMAIKRQIQQTVQRRINYGNLLTLKIHLRNIQQQDK